MANSKATGVAYDDPQFSAVTTGTLTTTGTTLLGDAAADLVGFHGTTGVAQATFLATNSINALSVSGVVGFISSTSLSNLVAKVNAIQQLLVDKGLMAAS